MAHEHLIMLDFESKQFHRLARRLRNTTLVLYGGRRSAVGVCLPQSSLLGPQPRCSLAAEIGFRSSAF
ncbi:hypothetical protein M569_13705, partial [Genlisea aurea]